MADPITSDTLVSHTDEKGRTLSGMGADVDQLAETMERHAPPPVDKKELDPTAAPVEPAEPAPPVSRGRQRFSELTKERDEAKAVAEAAKAEREALARERDELRQRLEAHARVPSVPDTAKEPKEPTYTRPEPTEDDIGTKYKTYAEFARDLAKWVFEQEQQTAPQTVEQQIRDILARERHRDQFQSAIQTSQDRGRKAYADFDTLLNSPVGSIPLAQDKDEAIQRVAFIAAHPQSEHIQYAILKNPALAEQLRDSDAYTFGVTVAGLVPKEPPKSTWTPPPPPHPTVGASTPTTTTPSRDYAKKGDFDSYRNQRAAERGVKPRY